MSFLNFFWFYLFYFLSVPDRFSLDFWMRFRCRIVVSLDFRTFLLSLFVLLMTLLSSSAFSKLLYLSKTWISKFRTFRRISYFLIKLFTNCFVFWPPGSSWTSGGRCDVLLVVGAHLFVCDDEKEVEITPSFSFFLSLFSSFKLLTKFGFLDEVWPSGSSCCCCCVRCRSRDQSLVMSATFLMKR